MSYDQKSDRGQEDRLVGLKVLLLRGTSANNVQGAIGNDLYSDLQKNGCDHP